MKYQAFKIVPHFLFFFFIEHTGFASLNLQNFTGGHVFKTGLRKGRQKWNFSIKAGVGKT